jgi:alkylation response protein AidB-like acyl-CoA dehydrogenase
MSMLSNEVRLPISARAEACIDWLRDYAAKRVNSRLIDERRSIPPHIVLDFGNQGLLAMQVPAALGGRLDLSVYDMLKVQRQLAAIDLTLAVFVGSNNGLGVRPILKFAAPALQQRYLPDLASGRILAALALSEPGAGSNPLDIQTTARATGHGEFVLDGIKAWSGNAGWAELINVFANQISTDGKSVGHAAFCVPANLKGVRQGPEALTSGLRGMVQNSVYLEGARIGSEYMLGRAGAGLSVANDSMLAARLGIAAICVGGMWRALQFADRYARRRVIGGSRLIDSDLVGTRLASMYAAALAADQVVDRLARHVDEGIGIPPEAYSAVKAISSEWLGKVIDVAIQTLGGRGNIDTNHLPQMARDARITRIFEGPTDTLFIYVGQRLVNDSSFFNRYLENQLGAKQGAAALQKCIERAREFISSLRPKTVVHAAIGELAALHLVKACTHDPLCLAWLDVELARADAGLQQTPLAHPALEKMHEEVANLIGDVEQTAPDEGRSLDCYLRKEFT